MDRSFEIDEARALVPVIRTVADELVPLRADLAERAEGRTELGWYHHAAQGSLGPRPISEL